MTLKTENKIMYKKICKNKNTTNLWRKRVKIKRKL